MQPDHYGTMYIKDAQSGRVVERRMRSIRITSCTTSIRRVSTYSSCRCRRPTSTSLPRTRPEIAERVNDEAIRWRRNDPDRFRALPSLPLSDVDAWIEEIDCVADTSFGPGADGGHAIVGADHLMFGTDYPFVDIDTKPVDVLDLPVNEKNAINGGNAAEGVRIAMKVDAHAHVIPKCFLDAGAALPGAVTKKERPYPQDGAQRPAHRAARRAMARARSFGARPRRQGHRHAAGVVLGAEPQSVPGQGPSEAGAPGRTTS